MTTEMQMMRAMNLVEKTFWEKELLLSWQEGHPMEEIENVGVMAGVADDMNVVGETEIGMDVDAQYGLTNMVPLQEPITGLPLKTCPVGLAGRT